jgi:FkbM family methyltransferase
MKKFDKWVFPDKEEHLIEWMGKANQRLNGRLAYQGKKYLEARQFVTNKRVAIDVGSHIGLWAYNMAHDFEEVVGFEPMKAHVECWRENMKDIDNATLFEIALGENEGGVGLETYTENSTGDTRILGKGNIPMKTLDSIGIQNVDFIKIDCEGYELNVLKGARETLLRFKPVVVVEQKRDMAEKFGNEILGAVKFLKELGAKQRMEISGDYILSWE